MPSNYHAVLDESPWDDNAVQFPRLLADIHGVGLSLNQWRNLARSMDLNPAEIEEIFERAERAFQNTKKSALLAGKKDRLP